VRAAKRLIPNSHQYEYDYENRIVKITKDSSDIAEFAYDAIGRKINVNLCCGLGAVGANVREVRTLASLQVLI